MAVTISIAMPTAVEPRSGIFDVSVLATAVDGAEALGTRSFSSSIVDTSAAGRAALATTLINEINTWKAQLTRQKGLATALATLKTAIEGGIG
jgi:hypothetical protein